MRSMLAGIAAVTFGAVAGCSSSTDAPNCDKPTTIAAYQDEISVSATVTSISSTGTSRLVEATQSSGQISFIVADTTAVFVRVGSHAPEAASACRLAVGEVVEIPLGAGFGDFGDSPPPQTVGQIVIRG